MSYIDLFTKNSSTHVKRTALDLGSFSLHRKEKKIDKDKIQPKLLYEPFSSQISSEPTAMKKRYLTIIPRARMGSESIAQEAESRMGY